MFLSLLFHKVGIGKYATEKERLLKHLSDLKNHYPLISPGQKKDCFSVCITFDDATYDFYHHIFPFILKEKFPVTLAVSPSYIVEKAQSHPSERLMMNSRLPFKNDISPSEAFCSWEEIREMVSSGLVTIASHGMTHCNLCNKDIDLEYEIEHSKQVIEKKIHTKIDSFVYPMGRFNRAIHSKVQKHYRNIFRIGSSINFSWSHPYQMVYRIPADNLSSLMPLFSFPKRIEYLLNYCAKRIQRR